MTATHTPGPWHHFGDLVADSSGDIYTTGKVICNVSVGLDYPPYRYINTATCRANGRLIAAAPDMLAECRRTQDEIASAIKDGVMHFTPEMLQRWFAGVTTVIEKATKED